MFNDFLSDANDIINETFGEPVTYIHAQNGFKDYIFAVFSSKTVLRDEGETEVLVKQSSLDVKLSDLSSYPKEKDKLEFNGSMFIVTEIYESGFGTVKLFLSKTGYGHAH